MRLIAEFHDACEERAFEIAWHRLLADEPCEDVPVGGGEEAFELVEVFVGHRVDVGVGEAAHEQVHFAEAATPCAES